MSTTYYSTFHPAESSGTKGSAAFAGSALNTAVIYLYRRSATALTAGDKPNATTTYTFDPPGIDLTGVTGWTNDIPAGSDPLYAVIITVASDNPTVDITTGEWSTPVILAQNGANGTSPIFIDLSNDTAAVPANSDGTSPNFTGIATTVSIFEGTTDVTASWTISQALSAGLTGTASGTPANRTFTPTGLTTDSGTATFTATRAGFPPQTIVFTISKAKAGVAGTPATVYNIRRSLGVIKRLASGTYSPTTITFASYSTTGSAAPALYAGRFIIATSTDGTTYTNRYTSSANESSYTYTILAGISHVRATLYLAGGIATIIDQEIIPVAVDGINAVSGFLTNEVHNVSANSAGGGYSLTGAGGTFKVFNGITDVTTSATFSVVAPATVNGLTMSIGAATGIYSLSGSSWTTDSESFTLRAVYNTVTIDLVYSISKSKVGGTGAQGPSLQLTASAQAFTFTDSVANPGSQTITLTATLQNLTGTPTWTTTPSVSLGGLETDLTRTLTDVNFGTNRQVTVEVTVAGVTDRITIVRLERNIVINSANRVQNSLFETGTSGADWGSVGDGGVTANAATLSSFNSFAAAVASGTVPNNTARLIFSSNRYFPVTAGETLFVGFGVNTGASTIASAQVLFLNSSNAFVTEISVSQVTASTNGRSTGFITVPAGATQGLLRIQLTHTTSGAVTATVYQPMVTSAAAGQTLLPAFTRGLNAQDAATVGAVAGTNLLDSGGRALTDSDISNTSQRVAVRQWAFNNNSLNGWSGVAQSGTAPTVTTGSQFVTFTANALDTSFMSPDMISVDGRVGRYLRMILSATVQLSATMRNVEVYFSTNAYAPIDGTRSKNGDWIPANHPTNGTPFEVLLDMHSLTVGGNAWRDEIVRRVRIDFDGTIPETIRIHEISVVYLGTATVGAPPGTPVGAYTDAALIQPAVTTAQTTANSKNRTFTGVTTPVGPQTGDLWSIPGEQRLRRWSGTAWEVQLEFIANARTSFTVALPTTSTFAQLGVGTLGVGPNGTTQISSTINYSPQTGGSGTRSGAIELTIDWRPVPGTGSWTQIGSSQTGSNATRAADIAPGEPGEITFGAVTIVRTLAGPVSVSNNEFRVTGRLTGDALQGTPDNAIISWVP
jgi:hypothetical protein